MKANKPLDYKVLKKDFIFVNILGCVAVFGLLGYMVLQKIDLIPDSICLMHDVLHLYCPGCGGTRATFALLKGHLLESLCCNPAVLLGAILILHYEVGVVVTLLKKNGKRYYCSNMTLVILYVVVILVFAVVRNYLLLVCGYDMLQDFL